MNREALRIEPYFSIGSNLVIKILERLVLEQDNPKAIRTDNGLEVIFLPLYQNGARKMESNTYIQPGKPLRNSSFLC